MRSLIRKLIGNKLVSYLYCVPDSSKILKYRKSSQILYLNGEQISDIETNSLIQEARFIEKTKLWEIMQNNLVEAARKTMFDKAKTTDDLFFGKAILYCLDIEKNIIETVKSAKKS